MIHRPLRSFPYECSVKLYAPCELLTNWTTSQFLFRMANFIKNKDTSKMLGPTPNKATTHYKGNQRKEKLRHMCQAKSPSFTLFFNQPYVWTLNLSTTFDTLNSLPLKIKSLGATHISQKKWLKILKIAIHKSL